MFALAPPVSVLSLSVVPGESSAPCYAPSPALSAALKMIDRAATKVSQADAANGVPIAVT